MTSSDSPKPTSSAPQKRRRKAPPRGPKIDFTAPRHQARILAMQSLFEDDLTEHRLDDILQEIGNQVLAEHRTYFARITEESGKAMEELTFLARNTDRDDATTTIPQFTAARKRLLASLFEDPDTAERDLTEDTLSIVRTRTEKRLRELLEEFGGEVEGYLATPADPFEDEDEESTTLRELEIAARVRIKDTIADDERNSRTTLMGIMAHTGRLSRGVREQATAVDPYIEKAAPAFPIPQLAPIDRVVLRIAVYELLFEKDVPYKAVINEAVEIAKRFGGPSSGKFTNGVLRTISERINAANDGEK